MVRLKALKPMGDHCLPALQKTLARLSAAMAVVMVIGVPTTALGSHNLLENGDFTSGIAGWTLETDSGFALAWDPSVGQPSPGSLILSGTFEGLGLGVAEALSECFEAPPDGVFHVRANILAETTDGTVKCLPLITQYEGAGCTGERTQFGSPPTIVPTEPDVWESQTTQWSLFEGFSSFRVSLFFWLLSGEEAASCNFDSVVLSEAGAAATEIPSASEVGLALLVGLLGLSASWLLRTRF